jgi:hypothetical protein
MKNQKTKCKNPSIAQPFSTVSENNHGSGKVVISDDFDENLIDAKP